MQKTFKQKISSFLKKTFTILGIIALSVIAGFVLSKLNDGSKLGLNIFGDKDNTSSVEKVKSETEENKNNKNSSEVAKTTTSNSNGSDACSNFNLDTFKSTLKSEIRDFGEIDVVDSPIKGLKEVRILNGEGVIYSNCAGDTVILGAMLSKQGTVNHTQKSMEEVNKEIFAKQIATLNKDLAIKMGSGKNEVLIFTDPDCPYCRQAEQNLKEDEVDATRYVFITPIEELHPEAKKKTIHIFCSDDPKNEFLNIMRGQEPTEWKSCDKGINQTNELLKLGKEWKVQGTPTFFVNGTKFVGADPRVFEMIKKKAEPVQENGTFVEKEVTTEAEKDAETLNSVDNESNKETIAE